MNRTRLARCLGLVLPLVLPPSAKALDAVSRTVTVFNLPDTPPGPLTEAISRSLTVHNLPDHPPEPITEAVSRSVTIYNLPDHPPGAVTFAVSRAVTVLSGPATGTPSLPLPASFALGSAVPSPFRESVTIRFDVPRESPVTIRIFDLRGALVTTLLSNATIPPGHRELTWNGRDAAGNRVASGVFFCRMDAGGFRGHLRLVRLR